MTNEELANELDHRLSLRTGNLPGLRLYLPQEKVDAIISALRENARLREALRKLSEGDVPRPAGQRYRADGVPSKHDACTHGRWMYEDCDECSAEFAESALRQLDTPNMSNTP